MKCFKKHSIVFLSLIMSMLFTASAHADLLYGAMSGGYTTDIMGVIIGNAAPDRVVTNLGGTMGARISSFRTETGGARAAFCEYANNKGDSIKIYKPYDGTWTPIKDFPLLQIP